MCVCFVKQDHILLLEDRRSATFVKAFFKVLNRNRIDADWVQTGCRLEADWTCRLSADWKQTRKNLPTKASPRALIPVPRQGTRRSTPSSALAIVQPGNKLNFSFCWQPFNPATYSNSVLLGILQPGNKLNFSFCWKWPLRTAGLLEAAHQYTLQGVSGSASTPTPVVQPGHEIHFSQQT